MNDLMEKMRAKLAREKGKKLPPRIPHSESLVLTVPDPKIDLDICARYASNKWRRGTWEDGYIAAGSELACAALIEPLAPGAVERERQHLLRDATDDDYRFDFEAMGLKFDPKCVRRSTDFANLIVDDPKPDVRYPLFWAMDQVLHGELIDVRYEFLGWSEGDPELFDEFEYSNSLRKPYRKSETLDRDVSRMFGLPSGSLPRIRP